MKKETTSLTEEKLTELYLIKNLTVREIAEKYQLSTATVNRSLKKYNIQKSEDQRRSAISKTKQNKTAEEKLLYSKHVSEARLGKGIGVTPWNKNKKGLQVAWNKGFTMTEEAKQHLKNLYNNLPEEEKQRRKEIISKTHKNKIPWNRGLTYKLDPETIKKAKEKEITTKKLNGNFKTSTLEESFYERLCNYFPKEEIKRQYFNKENYPFNCDFYVEPLKLYIELNGNWTHGFRPYDPEDARCQEQLRFWQEKAIESDYYKNAIYTWTDLDVRKRLTATKNNLLFIQLYTEKDIEEFFSYLDLND